MKALTVVFFLALLLALMISTNPSVQDYSEFVRNELVQRPAADDQDEFLQALMVLFGGLTESVILASTDRTNYLILSTYETDVETYHIECIGIFGHFFGCRSMEN